MSKLGHIYMINDGVLYTNNNGYDKLIKPMIPLSEFLEDCHFLSTFKEFKEMTDDMIKKEIDLLPKHMKDMALNDIKNSHRLYLEKQRKQSKINENIYDFVGNKNGLTKEECKYIYEESEKLMPILLIQYKMDLNMICKKMKEYQMLLSEACRKKREKK